MPFCVAVTALGHRPTQPHIAHFKCNYSLINWQLKRAKRISENKMVRSFYNFLSINAQLLLLLLHEHGGDAVHFYSPIIFRCVKTYYTQTHTSYVFFDHHYSAFARLVIRYMLVFCAAISPSLLSTVIQSTRLSALPASSGDSNSFVLIMNINKGNFSTSESWDISFKLCDNKTPSG